jgi:hypothetical protein
MVPSTKGKELPSWDWLMTSGHGFPTLPSWPSPYMRLQGALTEPLNPAKPIKTPFLKLQQALLQAPALSLPNLDDPFKLYVTERGGMALGVLGQMKGPTFAPGAYLSKQLDPVVKGWQPCLCALAVVALLTQEAFKLTFGKPTTVLSPHLLTDLSHHCPPTCLPRDYNSSTSLL